MSRRAGLLAAGCAGLALAGLALAGAAQAQQTPEVPVMVGVQPDLDACLTQGVVSGLDASGDNFLAVRSGPGSGYGQIDALHTDDVVAMCETRGRWIGIVYQPGDRQVPGPSDCGVGSPIWPRQAYPGTCRSGWVFEAYVTPYAG
ncbi:MAG: integron [Alphaproteobacteria bacterium]